MDSWVYIFSRFTPEALLFEALLICILCGGYAAFWIFKKRRMGVIDKAVPAGVVKIYLNELISDAQQMRAQLFGLLQSAGIPVSNSMQPGANQTTVLQMQNVSNDPAMSQKIVELETRMADQAKAMHNVLLEKERIEKDLIQARSASQGKGTSTSSSGSSSVNVSDLQAKIKLLEAKLAEYSIIEDDLANLKRLQQENTQLKMALAGKGDKVESSTEPATEAEPELAVAPEATSATPPAEEAEPELAMAPEAASATPPTDARQFEEVVDTVEKSLQPEQTKPVAAGSPKQKKTEELKLSTSTSTTGNMEKTDADLVAEFEKMLNN
jgi:hypothetical protein